MTVETSSSVTRLGALTRGKIFCMCSYNLCADSVNLVFKAAVASASASASASAVVVDSVDSADVGP